MRMNIILSLHWILITVCSLSNNDDLIHGSPNTAGSEDHENAQTHPAEMTILWFYFLKINIPNLLRGNLRQLLLILMWVTKNQKKQGKHCGV